MNSARGSLAARLTIWYAATAFLLVAGAGIVQYRSLLGSLEAEDDLEIAGRLRDAVRVGTTGLTGPAHAAQQRMIVRYLDYSCRPLSPDGPGLPPPSCPSAPPGASSFRDWRSPGGAEWRIAAARVDQPGAKWVEVLLDRSTDDRVLRAYVDELVLVLAASLLLAAGLGYGIARRGLRPLNLFAHRVAEIDARSLGNRLSMLAGLAAHPKELQGVVTSLDGMLDRLERAFRALTEFSTELAHELRTPVHVLRQQTEVALQRVRSPGEYQEVLGANLEELDRMRRMVDDILFLARAEDPRAAIERIPLPLADEVAAVIDFLSALAAERGIAFVSDVPDRLELHADRMLLRRALVNIIGNAIRHTPVGGSIEVGARDDGDAVVLEVRDNGAGIAPEILQHVFDRHVRGTDSAARNSEGAGLGLAIVRGVMSLHGGTAMATSAPGEGTRIILRFPRQPAAVPLVERSTDPHQVPGRNLSEL